MSSKTSAPVPVFAMLNFVSGVKQGTRFQVMHSPAHIGRLKGDIVLGDPLVSFHHATITWNQKTFRIRDEQSTNGTWVNQQRITETPLNDGDEIVIGSSTIHFHCNLNLPSSNLPRPIEATPTPKTSAMGNTSHIKKKINAERQQVSKNKTTSGTVAHTMQSLSKIEIVLEVIKGRAVGKRFTITQGTTTIGRAGTDIVLSDPLASDKHALLEAFDQDHIFIRDTGSISGTFVNKEKIVYSRVNHRDTITIGATQLQLIVESKTLA